MASPADALPLPELALARRYVWWALFILACSFGLLAADLHYKREMGRAAADFRNAVAAAQNILRVEVVSPDEPG